MKFYLPAISGGNFLPPQYAFVFNQKLLFFFFVLVSCQGSHFSMLNAQPEISLTVIANGFSSPVDITNAGDERLFVVEQGGVIKIIDGNQEVLATPFLDIDSQVGSGGERGLLGLAFHPDYAQNGYFFVYYTKNNGDTRVSRFSVSVNNPNIADTDSEEILLEVDQPYSNHNGGCIKFGPDGYLYIGLGDGGSGGDPQGNGQNRLTLLAKMLRIDIDNGNPYSIPETNPFAFDDFTLDEIWALGLRNPWRFSFDRLTGDLWIADVGQNAWEEIDFQAADSQGGENYGWRCFEGDAAFDNNPDECPSAGNLTWPVHVYSNNFNTGCSVTGGFVYRGDAFTELFGHYLYTDFCSGRIWSLTKDANGDWVNVELLNSTNNEFSSFGENSAGELYLAGLSSGKIYKIVEVCADFAVSGQIEDETCESDEDGSISLNIENGTAPYQVSWSNGSSLQTISNLSTGSYSVTVSDNNGCEGFQNFEINNGTPDAPVIGVVDNNLSVPNLFAGYQWYLNGEVIVGANEASFQALISGSYNLVVFSAENCSAETATVEVVVNNLHELELNSFEVRPNPFYNEIRIKIDAKSDGKYQLIIQELTGKIIYETTELIGAVWEKTLSLKDLPSGIYLLSVEKNDRKIVKKLTKQ